MVFFIYKNILTGKPINVFNNGNHCRNFTFIDDIVEGITRTLDLPPTHNLSNKTLIIIFLQDLLLIEL